MALPCRATWGELISWAECIRPAARFWALPKTLVRRKRGGSLALASARPHSAQQVTGAQWPGACRPRGLAAWDPREDFTSSGGVNPPCGKVLGLAQNACAPQTRRLACARKRAPPLSPAGDRRPMAGGVPPTRPCRVGPQGGFHILGRSESALRQGFGPCPKRLCAANAAARLRSREHAPAQPSR